MIFFPCVLIQNDTHNASRKYGQFFFFSSFNRFHASLVRWTHRVCCGGHSIWFTSYVSYLRERSVFGGRLSRRRYKLNRLKDVVKTFHAIYASDLRPIQFHFCVFERNCIKWFCCCIGNKKKSQTALGGRRHWERRKRNQENNRFVAKTFLT